MSDVARELNIGRSTINRWVKNPAFNELIEEKRLEYRQSFRDRINALGTAAITTLQECLTSPDETVKLKAVQLLFSRIDLLPSVDKVTDWKSQLLRECKQSCYNKIAKEKPYEIPDTKEVEARAKKLYKETLENINKELKDEDDGTIEAIVIKDKKDE